MSLEPLLEMQGISKTFNGLRVLKNVGLKVYPGEIHALMGENGAGKSTLMKILSGAYQADPGGEIRIAGQRVPTFDPATAKALGIAVIYQELSLCPNLSVAENIYLGRELRRGGPQAGQQRKSGGTEQAVRRFSDRPVSGPFGRYFLYAGRR